MNISCLIISVADPGAGAFLTPGSGIRNRFFPDPGSQTHIFESLITIFLVKTSKIYNSLKIGPNSFLQHFKNKIILNFVRFVATKQGMTTNLFSPLSFVDVFGSGIRDPGSRMGKNQDPGSGINPGSATLLIMLVKLTAGKLLF